MPTDETKSLPRSSRKQDSGSNYASAASAGSSSGNGYGSLALVGAARDRAFGMAQAAREWLSPSVFPADWTAPLSHLESLTTVMFSPLAAHPVYRSESLAKALHLMQQQQRQRSSSQASSSTGSEIVLRNAQRPWPSSAELLKADIPESSAPLSLFQGFAAAYPSLANSSSSSAPTKPRSRRKKQNAAAKPTSATGGESGRSLTQYIAEREQRMRESDKLQMQKSSTANEIRQIDLQIEELVNKRKSLEAKRAKLEVKEQQLRAIIASLNESILAIEESGRASESASVKSSDKPEEEDVSDDEPVEQGTCYKTLEGHEDDILCIDFNHPKGVLVSSSLDGTIRAWDLHRSRCLGALEGHSSLVRCLQLEDACLLTGSDDGSIRHWDLSLVPPAPSPSSVGSSSGFSSSAPNSPALSAATTTDEALPMLSDCCISTLEGHQAEVTAIYTDKATAVSGSNDKTMKQWDLETRQCILTLDVMWASSTSRGGQGWRSSSSFDQWSLGGFLETRAEFVGALQFWNFALASGTIDGKLRMWDLRTGQAHRTLAGHTGAITCLQFDEVHLVSGSVDKSIKVWDLRTGSVFDTFTYQNPVTSLQFDALRIVSATKSAAIDVYNRRSFQHTSLMGHTGEVNSVRFRDGVLASSGSDRVVKLWAL